MPDREYEIRLVPYVKPAPRRRVVAKSYGSLSPEELKLHAEQWAAFKQKLIKVGWPRKEAEVDEAVLGGGQLTDTAKTCYTAPVAKKP